MLIVHMFNYVIKKIQISMFSFQEREQKTLRSKVGLKKILTWVLLCNFCVQ